jgi:tetratricopeptide (TPR) repeat protein
MVKLYRNLMIIVICVLFCVPSGIGATVTDSLYQAALALPDSLPVKRRINAFKRIIKHNQQYAPAHNQLAWLYLKQNKVTTRQSAGFAINRALEIAPNNLDYQLTKGAILWAQGHHQKAVAHYREIVERYPNCADATHWLGYYYGQLFLDDKDRQEFVSMGSSVGFGTGSFDMSSYSRDQTLASLETRIRAAGFGKVQFTQDARKNRDLALKYLGKTLELRQDFRDAFYQVGLIHLESGRPERLVAAMQYLLDRQPGDKDALLFCGLGYLVQGLPGRANRYFKLSLSLMHPEERAVLEDVSLIASKNEQRQFASLETYASDVWAETLSRCSFGANKIHFFLQNTMSDGLNTMLDWPMPI